MSRLASLTKNCLILGIPLQLGVNGSEKPDDQSGVPDCSAETCNKGSRPLQQSRPQWSCRLSCQSILGDQSNWEDFVTVKHSVGAPPQDVLPRVKRLLSGTLAYKYSPRGICPRARERGALPRNRCRVFPAACVANEVVPHHPSVLWKSDMNSASPVNTRRSSNDAWRTVGPLSATLAQQYATIGWAPGVFLGVWHPVPLLAVYCGSAARIHWNPQTPSRFSCHAVHVS